MTIQTKALLAGIVGAAVVLVIGFAVTTRLENRLRMATSACIEQGKTSEFAKLGGELICDPIELARSSGDDPPGVQGNLARSQRELVQWQEWPIRVAVAILVVLGLPWVWYFLLRRIRELREALIGR